MTGGFSEGCFFPLPLGLPGLRFAGDALGSTAEVVVRASVAGSNWRPTLDNRGTWFGWHAGECVFHEGQLVPVILRSC